MINDLKKALEAAQRKAEQGSQQTQGEVLELELEGLLKKNFLTMKSKKSKKASAAPMWSKPSSTNAAKPASLILWESKNAQWQDSWLAKLREDQRQAKAHLAVLVATNHPKEIGLFKYVSNVWVVDRQAVLSLAMVLRFNLVNINYERRMNVGKNEKWKFYGSMSPALNFPHRIEAIVESFTNLQTDIEKEKRFFRSSGPGRKKNFGKLWIVLTEFTANFKLFPAGNCKPSNNWKNQKIDISTLLSQGRDSNSRLAVYDTATLPAELPWQQTYFINDFTIFPIASASISSHFSNSAILPEPGIFVTPS